jgi:hypothetical protein
VSRRHRRRDRHERPGNRQGRLCDDHEFLLHWPATPLRLVPTSRRKARCGWRTFTSRRSQTQTSRGGCGKAPPRHSSPDVVAGSRPAAGALLALGLGAIACARRRAALPRTTFVERRGLIPVRPRMRAHWRSPCARSSPLAIASLAVGCYAKAPALAGEAGHDAAPPSNQAPRPRGERMRSPARPARGAANGSTIGSMRAAIASRAAPGFTHRAQRPRPGAYGGPGIENRWTGAAIGSKTASHRRGDPDREPARPARSSRQSRPAAVHLRAFCPSGTKRHDAALRRSRPLTPAPPSQSGPAILPRRGGLLPRAQELRIVPESRARTRSYTDPRVAMQLTADVVLVPRSSPAPAKLSMITRRLRRDRVAAVHGACRGSPPPSSR